MKKECLLSFRIVKIRNKYGKEAFGLELSSEDGRNISLTTFSTIEKLVDAIYDYFDPELNY